MFGVVVVVFVDIVIVVVIVVIVVLLKIMFILHRLLLSWCGVADLEIILRLLGT